MPTEATRPVARQMIAAVLRHGSRDGPTDRDLLARFVADRAEEAFAELVRRHGSMVLSVARRVTSHHEDAEDAFQAAFMVLARRAGHIARPELLGNWLYGVAYRTALEARTARRRVKEQQPVSAIPEPAAPIETEDTADLRRTIDEELSRLPEKYRSAVVLCDLEGVCRKEAAGRLRIPEGTLSSRLAHARKILAGRLMRRGVSASAGAIATALGREASASVVPHQLIQHTARAAARSLRGGMVPPDVLSNRVTSLTDGVMKAMIATRLRMMTGAGMLALSLMGLGAAAVVGQFSTTPAVQPKVATGGLNDAAAPPPAKAEDKSKPKSAEPKFAAKGIEDEDVPYAAMPTQAVVRYETGKLIVRQRTRGYVTIGYVTDPLVPDSPTSVPSLEIRSSVIGKTTDAADVSVFDMKGNRVADKVWKEKLKADQHVLVAADGKLPHPRELTPFKDDTLLVVLPSDVGDIGAPGVSIPPAPAFPPSPTLFPPPPFDPNETPPPPALPPAPSVPKTVK